MAQTDTEKVGLRDSSVVRTKAALLDSISSARLMTHNHLQLQFQGDMNTSGHSACGAQMYMLGKHSYT